MYHSAQKNKINRINNLKENIFNFNQLSNSNFIVKHKPYSSCSISPKKKAKKFQSTPFSVSSKHKTNFGYVYSAGGIPCHLDFSGVKMRLKWTVEPKDLNYEKLIEVCFEGLLETEHPYNFIATQSVKELLTAENAIEKVTPFLDKLLVILRKVLQSSNENVFLEGMNVLMMLSDLVREKMNMFLFLVLQQINRHSFNKKYKEKVSELLNVLEGNGGNDAYLIIKSRIPTYNPTL